MQGCRLQWSYQRTPTATDWQCFTEKKGGPTGKSCPEASKNKHTKNNITECKWCTMKENVTIAGIKEHTSRNCKRNVEHFLENTLCIVITDGAVQTGYLTGSVIQWMINVKSYTSMPHVY